MNRSDGLCDADTTHSFNNHIGLYRLWDERDALF